MGKGALFAPAAHGPHRKIDTDPEGVDGLASRRLRLHKNIPRKRRTFDPFRVEEMNGSFTVGGGHKNRALAHGYSIFTPAGFKDPCNPDFHTPRVQPKLWVKISPRGEGGPQGGG